MPAELRRAKSVVERIFLDSNVLLYAYSETDPHKRQIARGLADEHGAVVSTQILSEFANVVLRKFRMSPPDARQRVAELAARCDVIAVTPAVIMDAIRVHERFGFGFFDSQVIAAALAAGATTLYSEDRHHGQTIDGQLRIVSPFTPDAQQPRGRYRVRRPVRS